ncbi:MAG TPA: hypothetical protein VGU20_20770 [Stellaceae bacterium]|nr:hypothetical protein [Stellaceae bacterium]
MAAVLAFVTADAALFGADRLLIDAMLAVIAELRGLVGRACRHLLA